MPKLKYILILLIIIFAAYFLSGQYLNVKNKTGNKQKINISFQLHNATSSEDSYLIFFRALCKSLEGTSETPKDLKLVIRNKPRASLKFIKCSYQNKLIQLETEAIMTKNGYVIDGTKITTGSKTLLKDKNSSFIAYVHEITTNKPIQ